MGKREGSSWDQSMMGMLAARERGDGDRRSKGQMMVTRNMIERLGLEKELQGHTGCVNCLEWNRDGSILASASDDLHVILWDPFRYKELDNITTHHTGNIFSVKFLTPDTIATCAADGTVRVRSLVLGSYLRECTCHCGRVKRLACADNSPDLVWSAAEDGFVIQHDMRAPHRCKTDSPVVLINLLNHLGRQAEAKCLAINQKRPYQLAVGANDFYVRLYDMRMIKLSKLYNEPSSSRPWLMWERQNMRTVRAGHGDPDHNVPHDAATYYAPGHLSLDPHEQTFPKKTATYVAFSDDGNELLVNMGSEQVYIFDVNGDRRPTLLSSVVTDHGYGNGVTRDNKEPQELPEDVARLKEEANEYVKLKDYFRAIEVYNEAIARRPRSAVLRANRAAALIKRGWSGDLYAAVRDCHAAIQLDRGHLKSYFRLAKALLEMRQPVEAQQCMDYLKKRFPTEVQNHAVALLEKDINIAVKGKDEVPAESSPISAVERAGRALSRDYGRRLLGHCNTTTDIKEANFLGHTAQYVAAGSDDGSIFIWSRRSCNLVRVLRGDESIVNCVQLHPALCLLASSGIEPVVRLWSPRPEDGGSEPRAVQDSKSAATANQQRMRSDPFEAMLLNIGFPGGAQVDAPNCRTS